MEKAAMLDPNPWRYTMTVHVPSFNTPFSELEAQARTILAAEEQLFAERRPKAKVAHQKSNNGFF